MKRAIVFGSGFVGGRLAKLLAGDGWSVIATTRATYDITDAGKLAAAPELHGADVVISAVSSRRGGEDVYREVYLNGMRNILAHLHARHVLFVSSTSVYGQNDGSWATEESPADPAPATSRILREAEESTLAAGGTVARLAGIYGPGRSVLLQRAVSGEAVIEGDGARFINQIHADDAAAAIALLVESPAGIYNVADDTPTMQRDCYEWLAAHLGKPLPPSGPVDIHRKRGVTNKRVSNAKLRSLGWAPVYPSFREAVLQDPALLAAALADGSGDAPP